MTFLVTYTLWNWAKVMIMWPTPWAAVLCIGSSSCRTVSEIIEVSLTLGSSLTGSQHCQWVCIPSLKPLFFEGRLICLFNLSLHSEYSKVQNHEYLFLNYMVILPVIQNLPQILDFEEISCSCSVSFSSSDNKILKVQLSFISDNWEQWENQLAQKWEEEGRGKGKGKKEIV